jgi:hypothetical protein
LHPSLTTPHVAPSAWQVVGVQLHAFFTHVPASHVPQSSVPPQPSVGVPHAAPIWSHVLGVHPHLFGVAEASPASGGPPPQVCPAGHPPHATAPPQVSEIVPHLPAHDVLGTHVPVPQVLATPPPPHVWAPAQVGGTPPPSASASSPASTVPPSEEQTNVPPQPSGTTPHDAPCAAQGIGWQTHLLSTHPAGASHVPQVRTPPHMSGWVPQEAPSWAHVVGHVQTP